MYLVLNKHPSHLFGKLNGKLKIIVHEMVTKSISEFLKLFYY